MELCSSLMFGRTHALLFAVRSHHMSRLRSFAPQASKLLPCTRCSYSSSLVNINIETTHLLGFRSTFEILHRVANQEICRYRRTPTFTPLTPTTMPSLNEHEQSQNTEPATELKKPALDLAALAREREERQRQRIKKRERSISPPATRKTPKLESETVSLPSGAKLTSFSAVVQDDQSTRKSENARASTLR